MCNDTIMNKTQTTLFRQGLKFEQYWGSEVRALHMNTRSVYRLLADDDIAITHSAPYVDGESVDQFSVTLTEVTAYHSNGNVLSSVTKTLGVYDNWLDAYYKAFATLQQKTFATK